MGAVTHMAHAVRRENEVLAAAYLMSPVARARSATTYLRVRLGVMVDGRTEWLGTHSGAESTLGAGSQVDLLPRSKSPFRLRKGQTVVVEQFLAGVPSTVRGASVEIVTAVTGQRSGRTSSPVGPGQAPPVSAAMAQIDHSGGWERTHLVLLSDDPAQEDVS